MEIVCAAANGSLSFQLWEFNVEKSKKAQKNWRAKFVTFEETNEFRKNFGILRTRNTILERFK
jgi:hypothetical protein